MGLNALQQAVEKISCMGDVLSGADREYVVQFAFQTGDTELTEKLLCELSQLDVDREAVYSRFNTITDFKPDWIRSIENLLVSIEMYRIQEEKAARTLAEILSAFGMGLSEQEVKALTPEKLRDHAAGLKNTKEGDSIMAEEIQEAVQIIRVAYDGIDIAMKVGSGTLGQVKKAFDLIVALLDHEKPAGKTNMRKLLLKGGDLQVLQFATEDLKQVEKFAKKYGILYSALPDINKKDGMSEILFHTEAVPRVNMMLQKLKTGRIGTIDDYLKNGDEKELDKVFSVLKGHKKGNGSLHTETLSEQQKTDVISNGLFEKAGLYAVEKADTSVEEISEKFNITTGQAGEVLDKLENTGVLKKTGEGRYQPVINRNEFMERISRYREISGRVQAVSQAHNKNLLDISISKKLIAGENDHAVKTRIPGTWGENARYLWIEKEKISEIHSGKSILTSLDSDKEYKLYSSDNRVAGTMNGGQLYENHYDRVEAEVRKRHAEAKQKAEVRKRLADAEKETAEVTGKLSVSAVGRHLP